MQADQNSQEGKVHLGQMEQAVKSLEEEQVSKNSKMQLAEQETKKLHKKELSGKLLEKTLMMTSHPWSANGYLLLKRWFKTAVINLRKSDIKMMMSAIKSWLYSH